MNLLQRVLRVIILIAILGTFSGTASPVLAGPVLIQPASPADLVTQPAVPAAQPAAAKDGPFGMYLPVVVSAAVTPAPTIVTIPAGGGSASFNGGQIKLDFPAGAFNGPVTLKVLTPVVPSPADMTVIGPGKKFL